MSEPGGSSPIHDSNADAELADYIIRGACHDIDGATLAKSIVEGRDRLDLSLVEPWIIRDAISSCHKLTIWLEGLLVEVPTPLGESDSPAALRVDAACAGRFGIDGQYDPACCRFPKACSPFSDIEASP